MPLRIVRLGTPRTVDEGTRLGTVRRPPRGVPKVEFASRNFYDVWLPELSPSAELVKQALAARSDQEWSSFEKQFRRELAVPVAQRWIETLSALSWHGAFAVGCYCENEARCHRSVLRALFVERGACIAGS